MPSVRTKRMMSAKAIDGSQSFNEGLKTREELKVTNQKKKVLSDSKAIFGSEDSEQVWIKSNAGSGRVLRQIELGGNLCLQNNDLTFDAQNGAKNVKLAGDFEVAGGKNICITSSVKNSDINIQQNVQFGGETIDVTLIFNSLPFTVVPGDTVDLIAITPL